MGFNYGLEKKKFDAEWEKLRREYRAAGMDEAAIEAMYEYDWKGFNAERAYCNHTQRMPDQCFDSDGESADDGNFVMTAKFFESVAVMPHETDDSRRYSWMDEIDSPELSAALHRLSPQQIEILTLIAFEGYNATEVGKMLGLTQQGVSWHIGKIRKILKIFKNNL